MPGGYSSVLWVLASGEAQRQEGPHSRGNVTSFLKWEGIPNRVGSEGGGGRQGHNPGL